MLEYNNRQYPRVPSCPARPIASSEGVQDTDLETYELNFLPPDLAAIACNHSHQINCIQRFNLHVEYVIPKATVDKVDDLQAQLRNLWEQTPVPPVLVIYRSAKLDREVECIVYPVC